MNDSLSKCGCTCQNEDHIVFSCSGASDVGYISDQVARKLSRNKIRKMNCLTVVATGTDEKIGEFKKCNILVIDGCSEDCGKKIMAMRGIDNYCYFRLTDFGYKKEETPTTKESVNEVFELAKTFV